MSLLELKNFEVSSRHQHLLGPIHFSAKTGEWIQIEDHGGGGKSLFFRALSGLASEINLSGELYWNQQSVKSLPRTEIFYMAEEPRIFDNLSVAQNLLLRDGTRILTVKELEKESRRILEQLPVQIPVTDRVIDLGPEDRYWIDLARILVKPKKLLFLDEYKSQWSAPFRSRVEAFLKRLQERGLLILEAGPSAHSTRKFSLRGVSSLQNDYLGKPRRLDPKPLPCLRIEVSSPEDSNTRKWPTLEVYPGEIFGILGPKGGGRRDLWRSLSLSDSAPTIEFKVSSPQSTPLKWGFVSGYRKASGIFSGRSAIFNLVFPRPSRTKKSLEIFEHYQKLFSLQSSSARAPMDRLSREDQQFIVLARGLQQNADIYFLEDIHRGLNMEAKIRIYQAMRQITDLGKTIVFSTDDPHEAVASCDRICLMRLPIGCEILENHSEALKTIQESLGGIS